MGDDLNLSFAATTEDSVEIWWLIDAEHAKQERENIEKALKETGLI